MGGSLAGGAVVSWLGITAAQAACFLAFWAMQARGRAGGGGQAKQPQGASCYTWPKFHRQRGAGQRESCYQGVGRPAMLSLN